MNKFGQLFRFKGTTTRWDEVKAQYLKGGNLVFAELSDTTGTYYHIYADGAEATIVTKTTFENELVKVVDSISDINLILNKHEAMLAGISGTTGSVKSYVDTTVADAVEGLISENIKTSSVAVADNSKAQLGVTSSVEGLNTTYTLDVKVADAIATGVSGLATAGQVADAIATGVSGLASTDYVDSAIATGVSGLASTDYVDSAIATGVSGLASTDYVDSAIEKLGNVMEFKGVVESVPEVPGDLTDYGYNVGDVVTVQSTGEEYVFDGTAWIEIGKVSITEAVTSLTGSTYVTLTTGEGEGAAKTGNVTVSVEVGEIKENGKAGLALASDVYDAVEAAKDAATVTGAAGYLSLDGKNVVIDAAQVASGSGTTSTDTKLATAGYVNDKVAEASEVAAKHSTVTTDTPDYVGVTTSVDTTTGGTSYHVNLSDAALAAKNHTIETITIDGQTVTTATTVQAALQDLFEGDKTASEGINQNHADILAHIDATTGAHAASAISYTGTTGSTATDVKAALDELYTKAAVLDGKEFNSDNISVDGLLTGDVFADDKTVSDALESLAVAVANTDTTVSGDTASYSTVTGDFANGFTVKNELATSNPAVAADKVSGNAATGLATDAYVQDYVESRLAWNVIS